MIMDEPELFDQRYRTKEAVPATPEQALALMENKLKCAQQELRDIQNSVSFRIGRFITFLPRKIRGCFRCIREHGLGYTVKLGLKKLTGKG